MRGNETERLVEPKRVWSLSVRRELDQSAAVLAARLDGPFQHEAAQAFAPCLARDPDALDLAAHHAPARKPGQKADLKTADDLAVLFRAPQEFAGIVRDRLERGNMVRVDARPAGNGI